MILKILLAMVLLYLFYQDLRYRAVYWFVFPAMAGGIIALYYTQGFPLNFWSNTVINSCFLILQLILISLYLSVRHRQWVNITAFHLGWGDILFLQAATLFLSPLNYLLFYLISISTVCFSAILMTRKVKGELKIPLAGMQALFLLLFLLADWNLERVNLTDDKWILNYLNP